MEVLIAQDLGRIRHQQQGCERHMFPVISGPHYQLILFSLALSTQGSSMIMMKPQEPSGDERSMTLGVVEEMTL